MKKELAIRVACLGETIQELESEIADKREFLKQLKETREAFLRELVDLVKGEQ